MNECGELCRSRTETISETDDCTVKQFTGENGQYLMTTYRIFPGVEFMYGDAHIQSVCFDEKIRSHRVFEITHCREGRLECSLDGEFWYLSQGDLMIVLYEVFAHFLQDVGIRKLCAFQNAANARACLDRGNNAFILRVGKLQRGGKRVVRIA